MSFPKFWIWIFFSITNTTNGSSIVRTPFLNDPSKFPYSTSNRVLDVSYVQMHIVCGLWLSGFKFLGGFRLRAIALNLCMKNSDPINVGIAHSTIWGWICELAGNVQKKGADNWWQTCSKLESIFEPQIQIFVQQSTLLVRYRCFREIPTQPGWLHLKA